MGFLLCVYVAVTVSKSTLVAVPPNVLTLICCVPSGVLAGTLIVIVVVVTPLAEAVASTPPTRTFRPPPLKLLPDRTTGLPRAALAGANWLPGAANTGAGGRIMVDRKS